MIRANIMKCGAARRFGSGVKIEGRWIDIRDPEVLKSLD